MTERNSLTEAQANAVYDILVEHCGAPERMAENFIYAQRDHYVDEWRFQGALGFGGKFRRGPGRNAEGEWGERWYVDYYPEDRNVDREDMKFRANQALELLMKNTNENNDAQGGSHE